MKTSRLIIILIVLTILPFSCKENKQETSQMKEVLAIHDEVMPKMGTIGNLISELDEKINESNPDNRYSKARQNLKDSHKSMMDWMKHFGDRFDGDEIMKGKTLTEEKQMWLNEEEAKVKTLRDQINTSIKTAEDLLKSN
ncbi:hypothetical protein KCTC52924_01634 [Arenibacter antarcticus]|uniref:Viral A-type inclusion protein n=1 Tax=Arenibacter antarcticus TaxID=2040469 RepID=A0ABW5VH29_9FLAO|nr:hypothetical protein [Arenibacter sp. H213]MCM4166782.1 hypothetical protein [Arenibacter sp. H213]